MFKTKALEDLKVTVCPVGIETGRFMFNVMEDVGKHPQRLTYTAVTELAPTYAPNRQNITFANDRWKRQIKI